MDRIDGILLVDKPVGWSSFDVVKKIKNTLGGAKIGHTGTLDPAASGLMILTIGKACKRANEFLKLDKTYEVEMILGKTSTTGDSEGKIEEVSSARPSSKDIDLALASLTGVIEQTPPVFSAIKVNGVPAYKRARKGEVFELKPRKTTIHRLDLVSYEYPRVQLVADVSSGTYVRTLVEDIGKLLGTGAYTSSLRRTRVGGYSIGDAVTQQDFSNTEKILNKISLLEY